MVPYEAEPFTMNTVGAVAATRAIGYPARGWITKIVVSQTSGTPTTFTVDIFNHADALALGDSQSVSGSSVEVPEECRKVTKTLNSDSAGHMEYFSEFETGGQGLVFVNKDVTPNKLKVSKLYFRITPTGSGPATFVVVIGGLAALN